MKKQITIINFFILAIFTFVSCTSNEYKTQKIDISTNGKIIVRLFEDDNRRTFIENYDVFTGNKISDRKKINYDASMLFVSDKYIWTEYHMEGESRIRTFNLNDLSDALYHKQIVETNKGLLFMGEPYSLKTDRKKLVFKANDAQFYIIEDETTGKAGQSVPRDNLISGVEETLRGFRTYNGIVPLNTLTFFEDNFMFNSEEGDGNVYLTRDIDGKIIQTSKKFIEPALVYSVEKEQPLEINGNLFIFSPTTIDGDAEVIITAIDANTFDVVWETNVNYKLGNYQVEYIFGQEAANGQIILIIGTSAGLLDAKKGEWVWYKNFDMPEKEI